ncbi:DNA-deoxyinosine glycosylase [Oceanobacillus senegalensis]|uniref:DNA-deoxyinosine glycosylase n=1 Tax=Oceanobacillus senegalensis TaxID=1936063 RepID=UPI000A306D42|nr:DNA-deoxyinosine glycosylase [Oceanobacillus senegalensis]
MSEKIYSFPPVLPDVPKVLILGSMPSVQSIEKKQYYGNPRNHFWPILFELFQEDPIEDYGRKVEFIKKHKIALWDSIGACFREGSLDADIKEDVPNDIVGLIKAHPSIRLIACNGTKSYETFRKNFDMHELLHVHVKKLPSTSPIPGRYNKSFAEKVEAWSVILKYMDVS